MLVETLQVVIFWQKWNWGVASIQKKLCFRKILPIFWIFSMNGRFGNLLIKHYNSKNDSSLRHKRKCTILAGVNVISICKN